MTLSEFEILLCDYLDGTLPTDVRKEVEEFIASDPAAAELARDAQEAMSLLEACPPVEPPAQLYDRILQDSEELRPLMKMRQARSDRPFFGWLDRILAPVLQPRLVMGMALTVLSFSLMARCAGVSPRQLNPSDLDPASVWASIDDKAHRTWNRSVKFYESLRLVYEVQTQVREWTEQQERESQQAIESKPVEERKIPASTTQAAPGEVN